MSDLEALRALVRMLREEGSANYEGPVPDSDGLQAVKLAVRPLPPPPPEKPAKRQEDEPMPRQRVPAGLGGMIHG